MTTDRRYQYEFVNIFVAFINVDITQSFCSMFCPRYKIQLLKTSFSREGGFIYLLQSSLESLGGGGTIWFVNKTVSENISEAIFTKRTITD